MYFTTITYQALLNFTCVILLRSEIEKKISDSLIKHFGHIGQKSF